MVSFNFRDPAATIYRALLLCCLLPASESGMAADIHLAVAENLPPYIYPKLNPNKIKGFELEVAENALAQSGHHPRFSRVPLNRVSYMLETNRVDGALTLNHHLAPKGTCLSDTYIAYDNVAISLSDNKLVLNSVADLSGKSIVAFQNAHEYLGEEFSSIAFADGDYLEMRNQELQVRNLFKGRFDIAIMDINIYKYFQSASSDPDYQAPVTIHRLFKPNQYRAAFRNTKTCNEFNRGLKQLIESEQYQHLLNEYSKLGYSFLH